MGIPNTFQNDSWSLIFSNIPNADPSEAIDNKLFDLYVKSFALPDLQLDTANTDFKEGSIRQVMSRANDNLQQLSIEFKVSEDMRNYFILYQYLMATRYGKILDKQQWLRNNVIKNIKLVCLDNQRREIGGMIFTNAIITSVGSLSLQMGVADQVTFSVTFFYEESKLYTKEIFGT
jgi:hypothetical protein